MGKISFRCHFVDTFHSSNQFSKHKKEKKQKKLHFRCQMTPLHLYIVIIEMKKLFICTKMMFQWATKNKFTLHVKANFRLNSVIKFTLMLYTQISIYISVFAQHHYSNSLFQQMVIELSVCMQYIISSWYFSFLLLFLNDSLTMYYFEKKKQMENKWFKWQNYNSNTCRRCLYLNLWNGKQSERVLFFECRCKK